MGDAGQRPVGTGRIRARATELGLVLHGPHPPHDPLDAVVVHGDTARTSGQLPRIDGALTCVGTLGRDVTVEQGREAAAVCALNALSVLETALGSLDRIERVLTVTGFVASDPDFHEQPAVIDGASQVLARAVRAGRSPLSVCRRGGRPAPRRRSRDRGHRRPCRRPDERQQLVMARARRLAPVLETRR